MNDDVPEWAERGTMYLALTLGFPFWFPLVALVAIFSGIGWLIERWFGPKGKAGDAQ